LLPDTGLFGVRPDLVLVLVVLWGALNAPGEAVLWGLLGGAFLDLFSAAPFGTAIVTLGVVAFFSAVFGEYLRRMNGALVLMLPALATVVAYGLMLAVMQTVNWPIDLPATVALVIIPAIAVNSLICPFVYVYVRMGGRWLNVRPRLG
jgi:rod shape-determining protein MreD